MKNFRFVVIGDSQGYTNGVNEKIFRKLLTKVHSLNPQPSFLLFTGDLAQNGEKMEELLYWRKIVTEYYPLSMIYPSIGNHNPIETNFATAFSHLPDTGPPGFNYTVYFFDYGNTRFFCLNSNRDLEIGPTQRNWLELQLQKALNMGIKHTFAFFHKPAYPVGRHVGSSLDYHPYNRNLLWEIIDNYKIDLVFNGHEHNYCRRRIDSAMNITVEGQSFKYKNSIYQIICGGGGAKLQNEIYCKQNVEVGPIKAYHFVVVDVMNTHINVNVFSIDNELLDSFIIDKTVNKYENDFLPNPPQQHKGAKKPDKITKKKFFYPNLRFWLNRK